MSRTARLLALVTSLSSLAVPVHGQVVRGEVVDAQTLQPLEGTVVSLLDGSGATVFTTTTSAEGRFIARLAGPGTFTVRVSRIGYESVASQLFEVAAGEEVFRRLEITIVPITLDAIEVESGRRCTVRPGPEALAISRVWEQARTALYAAAETKRVGGLRYDTEVWSQELDGRSLAIRSEQRAIRRHGILIPFGAREPDDLADNGYIQSVEDGRYFEFFAPTAEVLLSDPFLDTHCFRLEEGDGDDEGLIGLAFEPVRERDVPDIAGTLWLDRTTAELRYARMSYVSRDRDMPTEGAQARVDFQALPGGRWIVGRWSIRMPQMVEQRLPGGFAGSNVRRSVGSFHVEGGEVLRITDGSGRSLLAAERYEARGVVYDSLSGGPLRFAQVTLEGTAHRAVTDGSGRFAMTDVAPGRYRVGLDHARLDSLPEPARPFAEIVIDEGETAEVELAVPALQTVVEAVCPGLWRATSGSYMADYPWPGRGDAILTGIVMDATGQPLEGATAHVGWQAIRMSGERLDVRNVIPTATTGTDGRFTICGVPGDMPLSIWATVGESTSVVVEARARGRFAFAATIVR
jgi:hypothetical protein